MRSWLIIAKGRGNYQFFRRIFLRAAPVRHQVGPFPVYSPPAGENLWESPIAKRGVCCHNNRCQGPIRILEESGGGVMDQRCAVILAAGEGRRMRTEGAKAMCQVLFRPMLGWVLDNCTGAGINQICVVVGKSAQEVYGILPQGVTTAVQDRRLGTGHAVRCAREFLENRRDADILVTLGDSPFLFPAVIQKAYDLHKAQDNAVTVVSSRVEDPTGYGRILRQGGQVAAIVEDRDGDDATRAIKEINAGTYWFKGGLLLAALDRLIPANDQGELYLTDTLEILRKMGYRVGACDAGDSRIALGANTRRELHTLNEIAREMVFDRLYDGGVDIPVTDGVMISAEADIAPGVRILPGTLIRGRCQIGADCVVGPNSVLEDAVLGEGCVVRSSYITRSVLGRGVAVGPFSQIRPDCQIADGVKIGDFVEVKNSRVGEKTAIAHLTYVGDTDCGAGVNFGCGVVTVNYNGVTKNRTTIGDGAFIGCNTNLVAPVTVGQGAYTAAGSTVTVDLPPDSLCIARSRETIKPGAALKYRRQKGKE